MTEDLDALLEYLLASIQLCFVTGTCIAMMVVMKIRVVGIARDGVKGFQKSMFPSLSIFVFVQVPVGAHFPVQMDFCLHHPSQTTTDQTKTASTQSHCPPALSSC